jgi:hypothetical protein
MSGSGRLPPPSSSPLREQAATSVDQTALTRTSPEVNCDAPPGSTILSAQHSAVAAKDNRFARLNNSCAPSPATNRHRAAQGGS